VKRNLPGYFPRYLKDTIIKEVKGSVGILTFETEDNAKAFINEEISNPGLALIIKVEGLGEKKKVKSINTGCGGSPRMITEEFDHLKAYPPRGTVAFPAVRVLE